MVGWDVHWGYGVLTHDQMSFAFEVPSALAAALRRLSKFEGFGQRPRAGGTLGEAFGWTAQRDAALVAALWG